MEKINPVIKEVLREIDSVIITFFLGCIFTGMFLGILIPISIYNILKLQTLISLLFGSVIMAFICFIRVIVLMNRIGKNLTDGGE